MERAEDNKRTPCTAADQYQPVAAIGNRGAAGEVAVSRNGTASATSGGDASARATAAVTEPAGEICRGEQGASQSHGILLLISGPAGSGKTTLCDRLLAHSAQVQRVVTSTSRAPREGESHTVDYHFFAPETFKTKIDAGEFYEWAQVHGRYYGTLRSEIDDKLDAGVDLLINVDVQGANTFRRVAAEPQCPLHGRLVTVFVSVPDLTELRQRLRGRGTDDEAEIERRMQTAINELKEAPKYDHVIESRDREADFAALLSIYESERRRAHGS